MFERFTTAARDAVVDAQQQARSLGQPEIRPEHLLLGAMTDVQGVAATVLRSFGVEQATVRAELEDLGDADADALRAIGIDLEAVRRSAEASFGPGALSQPRRRRLGVLRSRLMGGHIPFTDAAKKALEDALRQALALEHNYIGTEHILLGLVADDRGPVLHTLRRVAPTLTAADLRSRVREELQHRAA